MNRSAAAGGAGSGGIRKEQPEQRALGELKTINRLKNQYYLRIAAFQSAVAPGPDLQTTMLGNV